MKILVLSFYYYPDLCAGSFRVEAFVKALRAKVSEDTEIHVITTMPNRYESFKKEALSYEKSDNLIIHRITLPAHSSGIFDQAKAFMVFSLRALRLIRKEKYQLVFATSSRLMTATLGALIAKRRGGSLYLDIRDLFVDTIQDVFSGKKIKLVTPIFYWIEKWTFSRADKINLVSRGFGSYFEKLYPDKKLSFYTNGIDQDFLNINFIKNISGDPKIVLYAGNIGEGQGLINIVPSLARQLKGKVNFRIIGDGGKRSEFADLLKTASDLDNIELVKPMSRESLINEYKNADILFLHLNNYPAFEKVLPSKLFEYAATGKPIWAGLAGYSADFCRKEVDNVALFSPLNDIEALVSFETLVMKSVDRKKFIEEFNRENIMNHLAEDVLKDL